MSFSCWYLNDYHNFSASRVVAAPANVAQHGEGNARLEAWKRSLKLDLLSCSMVKMEQRKQFYSPNRLLSSKALRKLMFLLLEQAFHTSLYLERPVKTFGLLAHVELLFTKKYCTFSFTDSPNNNKWLALITILPLTVLAILIFFLLVWYCVIRHSSGRGCSSSGKKYDTSCDPLKSILKPDQMSSLSQRSEI